MSDIFLLLQGDSGPQGIKGEVVSCFIHYLHGHRLFVTSPNTDSKHYLNIT